jgi:hypothetical protein
LAGNAIAPKARAEYQAQERAWRQVAELLEVNALLATANRGAKLRRGAVGNAWWSRFLRLVFSSYARFLPGRTSPAFSASPSAAQSR